MSETTVLPPVKPPAPDQKPPAATLPVPLPPVTPPESHAIIPPPDHYHGPSTGLSTEKGDSWLTAVGKINGFMAKVKAFIEHDAEAIDAAARKAIDSLEARIAKLEEAAKTPAPAPAQIGVQAGAGAPAANGEADPNVKPAE